MQTWLSRNRALLLTLMGLSLLQAAIAEWNPIPSGSMRPTLLEGDVVVVDRLAYDLKLPLTDISLLQLGRPARGDVVTFVSPRNGIEMIKRLVGLPGDTIELRAGVLLVNGMAARYSDAIHVIEPTSHGAAAAGIHATEFLAGRPHQIQFLPARATQRDFGPIVIPPESYFLLGDNRDNSSDSRYLGVVPRRLLIGRAHHILVSADITTNWRPRLERIGDAID